MSDYNKLPALNRFFKVISTDVTENGEPFLTALESINFPIYALMYHPEYQLMEFLSEKTFNVVNNPDTRAIFENLGQFIYKEATRLRIINGKRDLHFLPDRLESLWGRIATYNISPLIQIEGYAVPNLDFAPVQPEII